MAAEFISPFHAISASYQLLPLISANVENKVKSIVNNMNTGVSVIHTALKNNINKFKAIAESQHKPVITKYHPPASMLPTKPMIGGQHHGVNYEPIFAIPKPPAAPKNVSQLHTSIYSSGGVKPKPYTYYPYNIIGQSSNHVLNKMKFNYVPRNFANKFHGYTMKKFNKVPKPDSVKGGEAEVGSKVEARQSPRESRAARVETEEYKDILRDMGVTGYKHFENTVMRNLEKQEEAKVEATLHTFFENQNSSKDDFKESMKNEMEMIDSFESANDWQPIFSTVFDEITPMGSPTVDEQPPIITDLMTPLHTSIFVDPPVSKQDNPRKVKVEVPKQKPTTDYQSTTIERPRTKPSKRKSQKVKKALGDEGVPEVRDPFNNDSEYVQHLDSNSIATTASTQRARTSGRNHIQSLTTVKPKVRYHRNQPIAEESHSMSYVITPPSKTQRRQPSANASSYTTPKRKPSSSTTSPPTPPRSPHSRSSSIQVDTSDDSGINKRFIDKPKITGYRGAVKFTDSQQL